MLRLLLGGRVRIRLDCGLTGLGYVVWFAVSVIV